MSLHATAVLKSATTSIVLISGLGAAPIAAQAPELPARTPNLDVRTHVPLGAQLSVTDVIVEQDLSRPYAYVGRMQAEKGFDIISLADEEHAEVIYRWRIEDEELHTGLGGMDPKYFKWNDRYYVVQSLQFGQGGPNADAGAVIVDVTGLPNVSTVRTVGFVRAPETPGGFHNIFMYKHSDGRALLFATTSGPNANVYDMGRFVEGEEDVLVGQVPVPTVPSTPQAGRVSYHDFYVGYDPATQQDKFYGGGTAGYFVFDVTNLTSPELLITLTNVQGVSYGHTFTPTPDGRYVVGETEYIHAPLRIFDLQPALDGEVTNISAPVGVWNMNWNGLVHNHEMRYPYVFVSGYEDGLVVFDITDPTSPQTVAYYDTFLGRHQSGMCRANICNGAFGIDVRNADGLVVVSDMGTGFWAFRLDDFQGWDGRGWGMPNVSSAQNWDDGPAGRPDRGTTE